MVSELLDLLPTLATIAEERNLRRSLGELAQMHRVSASTYQRAFSRLIGESPKKYSRRLQLEWAALLLLQSKASVLDVALESGFESHEGFTRAFSDHFGAPPKDFRRQHARLAEATEHANLVQHLGPCIGLFRASLQASSPRRDSMNYDITRQTIPAALFLYQEERIAHANIAEGLGRMLPAVFGHAMANGLQLLSPPMAIYQEWGPGMVTLQAGLCVKEASEAEAYSIAQLPEGPAAVTIHTGPYDGLGDAHAAVEQFLHQQSWKQAGAAREIYLTDPGEVPDPKDWKTQIIYPIED